MDDFILEEGTPPIKGKTETKKTTIRIKEEEKQDGNTINNENRE